MESSDLSGDWYEDCRAALLARWFTEMSEATTDAARVQATESMVETCCQMENARVMQVVINSLINISEGYEAQTNKITLIQAALQEHRTQPVPNDLTIKAFAKLLSLAKQRLTAFKAHDVAFKADLRNPAHSQPLVLGEYVAQDGKNYMAMTTEWNSKFFVAAKSTHPDAPKILQALLESEISEAKVSDPGLAERMSQWDKDAKKAKKGKGKKKAGKGN